MTAKISASADGTKVYVGNSSENALEIDATGKLIKPVAPYNMAGNGPAFLATVNTVSANPSLTQLGLTEVFDTNNNFAASVFTPTIPGYYQLNANISTNQPDSTANLAITGNTGIVSRAAGNGASVGNGSGSFISCSCIRYFNGTTDNAFIQGAVAVAGYSITGGFFSGALVRQA